MPINKHIIDCVINKLTVMTQETEMRERYPEVNLPEKLKDGPTTLAMWLAAGLIVVLAIATLL